MESDPILEGLVAGRNHLIRSRWLRRREKGRFNVGRHAHCAYGAIVCASGRQRALQIASWMSTRDAPLVTLFSLVPFSGSLVTFNDCFAVNKKEVIALFDHLIQVRSGALIRERELVNA